MLILKSENLFTNTKEEWRKIENFLGLDEREEIPTLTRSNKGKGESKEIKENTKNKLRDYLAEEYRILEKDYGLRW